jgi:hypothetical protein
MSRLAPCAKSNCYPKEQFFLSRCAKTAVTPGAVFLLLVFCRFQSATALCFSSPFGAWFTSAAQAALDLHLWRAPSLSSRQRWMSSVKKSSEDLFKRPGRRATNARRGAAAPFRGGCQLSLTRRIAAICWSRLSTSRLSAKGFRRAFSARSLALVPSSTSELSSTRASGLLASL